MNIPNPTQIAHRVAFMLCASFSTDVLRKISSEGRPTVPATLTNQNSVSTHTPSRISSSKL